ncbi:signal protein [Hyalangium sp.]|uniref:signal protein n=1 Tax=Hyalangium sp. TaxID=2028555 RepID=UPI002D6762A4|nr:signal protein [Hyalangium sp.]HYH98208.1 signal protein [Hyalangium sp.]
MSRDPQQAGSKRRQWRNFLIEPKFQLKFAAYLITTTVVLAGVLGVFLYRNTQALLDEASHSLESRSRAAEASRELSNATLSNELIKKMGDPVFVAQLEATSRTIDERFEAERAAIVAQRAELVRRQRIMWLVFMGTLVGFISLITLVSIVLTHRVAGPLMRIRRMVKDVASGTIRPPPYGLRDTDELKDIFDATRGMMHVLRKQVEDDVLVLSHALERAQQEGVKSEWLEDLRTLESRIKSRL